MFVGFVTNIRYGYNSQEVKKFKNPYKMSFCSATHSFYTVIFKQLLPKSKHVRAEKKSDESVHFHEAASFFVVGFFFMHEIIFPPHFTFSKQGI